MKIEEKQDLGVEYLIRGGLYRSNTRRNHYYYLA